MSVDDKKVAEDHQVQYQIQKTHVTILNKAGKDEMNYAAALKAKLNFDKVARKFLLKYDSEQKLMKFSSEDKINLETFTKTFEIEFIPEFSEKVFEVIYEYNKFNNNKKKKKGGKNVNTNNLAVAAAVAVEEADDSKNGNDDEEHLITRLDTQRFIKSSKEVRKHIRERSLMPLETIFKSTNYADIASDAGKVSFDDFSKVFESKLGKKQCEQAFNLMKDKNDKISIVAYNNFREKGVHKMLGDLAKEEDEDDNTNDNNNDNTNDDATKDT